MTVSGGYILFKLKGHRMKNILLSVCLTCLLLSTATGCYAKGPWKGKVIDAETKQPIEGAAVVAVWYKNLRGPAGTETRFLDARETMTDKEGRFEIPSFWALDIFFVREITGPTFTIFKPSYGSYPEYQVNPKPPIPYETIFEEKEDVVELPRLKTKEERIKKLPGIGVFLDGHEQKVKEYIKLLNKESIEIGLQPYKFRFLNEN